MLLLLHVDDVLCLSKKSYLDEVLMPSLKAKYKVACVTISKVGDEPTFLKQHHVMVSEDEMAIQYKGGSAPFHGQLCRLIILWTNWCGKDQAHQPEGVVGSINSQRGIHVSWKVTTKDNVSELGTKRLSRDRMEYLMFLCKVDNMAESQMVGSSLAERLDEQKAMKVGIKMCKQVGMNSATSKSLMRVVLLNALSLGVAMDSKAMVTVAPESSFQMHELYKLFIACACTFVLMLLGFLWLTAYHGSLLQQHLHRLRVDVNLRKVLELLKGAMGHSNCEGV
eukprot:s88_g16.t1